MFNHPARLSSVIISHLQWLILYTVFNAWRLHQLYLCFSTKAEIRFVIYHLQWQILCRQFFFADGVQKSASLGIVVNTYLAGWIRIRNYLFQIRIQAK